MECKHPPNRQFAWFARDDSAPDTRKKGGAQKGQILCIACCDCGAVLRGGYEPQKEQEPPEQEEK